MKNNCKASLLFLLVICLLQNVSPWCLFKQLVETDQMMSVDYSPDGTMIVTGCKSKVFSLWSTTTYTKLFSATLLGEVRSAKFSKDQSKVALGCKGGFYYIYMTTSPYSQLQSINSGFTDVQELDFSWNSSKLIVCGGITNGNGIRIWDTTTWTISFFDIQNSFSSTVMSCKFAKDGSFAGASSSTKVVAYTSTTSVNWNAFDGSSYTSLDFKSDSSMLLVTDNTGSNKKIYIYTVAGGGGSPKSSASTGQKMTSIAYSKIDTDYAAGDDQYAVYLYNGTTGSLTSQLLTLTNPGDKIHDLRYSYDDKYLAVACKDTNLYIYKRNCGSVITIECPAETYLNGTTCRTCALDIVGCRTCSNSTTCYVCTDQHYYFSAILCKTCITAMTGCVQCNSSSICLSCLPTYYLSAPNACTICWLTINGCISCTNSSYCNECASSHYLSATNLCVSCLTLNNCYYCTSALICIQCVATYFISGGVCTKCPLNCMNCTSNVACTTCDNGYYLSTSSCLACPTGCLFCTSAAVCVTCGDGRYLSASACIGCNPECATCNSTAYCYSCSQGFYFSAGSCLPCGAGCITCSSAALCSSCNVGFYYLSASNSCSACSILKAWCVQCTNTSCLVCSSGNFYNSISTNCESCSTSMLACESCSTSLACLTCSNGYYLDLISSLCVICSVGCSSCYNSGVCTNCLIGFYYQSSNNTCMPCNCPACSSATVCLSCDTSKYLAGGICTLCSNSISNCQSCLSNTYCLSCQLGYTLTSVNTACSICSSPCASCSTTISFCTSCVNGFYLSISSCLACSNNCSMCTSLSTCSECTVGAYFQSTNSTCISCSVLSFGCQFCNKTNCYACSALNGFYMDSSTNLCVNCTTKIVNCLECVSNISCNRCAYSYQITSAGASCTSCSTLLPNCQVCNSSIYCTSCEIGYYAATGACNICSSHCLTCNSSTYCYNCALRFVLIAGNTCQVCSDYLLGCHICTSTTVCLICSAGYYKSANTCFACSTTLTGCLDCNSSSICLSCLDSSYLNATNNACLNCSTTAKGCKKCNSSNICLECQVNYYLSSNTCASCQDSNCLRCNNSTNCTLCKTGTFLSALGLCTPCSSMFEGCIFCSAVSCFQCQSGYYLNASVCVKCIIQGCSICTTPLLCLACNPQYYLSSVSTCSQCLSTNSGCLQCSSALVCLTCTHGYYLISVNNTCQTCSTLFASCSSCSPTKCLECKAGSFLSGLSCQSCASLINGCSFCLSSSVCLTCSNGFFNSNGLCSSCLNMTGCITCRNLNTCMRCDIRYYLSANSSCVSCSQSISNCIACTSSSSCLACKGDYKLSFGGSKCTIISIQTFNNYTELKLVSEYINSTNLKHTLWLKDNSKSFKKPTLNLTVLSNISYLSVQGQVVFLTILSYEYNPASSNSLIFYTNNPLTINEAEGTFKYMGLISNKRLLTTTNVGVTVMFRLMMNEEAVTDILDTTHGGALFLKYDSGEPEFFMSVTRLQTYNFYLFGLLVTLYLLVCYFIKTVVSLTNSPDKGQLIAHILSLKCVGFIIYPSYAEYVNYCYGFMTLDLPWLNQYFAQKFTVMTDWIPAPYALFYKNLSLASTYLLPLALLIFLFIIFFLIKKCTESPQMELSLKNALSFLYNSFIFGLVVATSASIQGAYFNSFSTISVNAAFYILGICLFIGLMFEMIYSIYEDRKYLYKLRVILKGLLLSILYISPIYLIFIVIAVEIYFIAFEYQVNSKAKLEHPKLWILVNVLPNIALLLLTLVPYMLLSIYLASAVIILTLVIDLYVFLKEFKSLRHLESLKIKVKQKQRSSNSFDLLSESKKVKRQNSLNTFVLEEEYEKMPMDQLHSNHTKNKVSPYIKEISSKRKHTFDKEVYNFEESREEPHEHPVLLNRAKHPIKSITKQDH